LEAMITQKRGDLCRVSTIDRGKTQKRSYGCSRICGTAVGARWRICRPRQRPRETIARRYQALLAVARKRHNRCGVGLAVPASTQALVQALNEFHRLAWTLSPIKRTSIPPRRRAC